MAQVFGLQKDVQPCEEFFLQFTLNRDKRFRKTFTVNRQRGKLCVQQLLLEHICLVEQDLNSVEKFSQIPQPGRQFTKILSKSHICKRTLT